MDEPGITVAEIKMVKAQTMGAPWGVWSSKAKKKGGGGGGDMQAPPQKCRMAEIQVSWDL